MTVDTFTSEEIEEMSEQLALSLLKCDLLTKTLTAIHSEISTALRCHLSPEVRERLDLVVLACQHHVDVTH